MTTQPEALRLAEDRPTSLNDDLYQWAIDAEDTLRRLHAVNVDLLAALKVAALAIHEYRTQGAPHAYWDDVQEQTRTAIAKAEGKQK